MIPALAMEPQKYFFNTNIPITTANKIGMEKINWGIIGCGDVTEVKSGPAFNKVPQSSLVAVMRRDAEKAKDYAQRHQVPLFFTDANELIHHPEVNAVYVATPPDTHAVYTIATLEAGKPVYVEKPTALNAEEAAAMAKIAAQKNVKLVVAHYRREQPLFQKIKQLLSANVIGAVRTVSLSILQQRLTEMELQDPKKAWRVDKKIPGGLFHDLAPHQLDILYTLFGEAKEIKGLHTNQSGAYATDDVITATILFENNILFNGIWSFSATYAHNVDECIIYGDEGILRFSFFKPSPLIIETKQGIQELVFPPLQHVQQPMIESTVNYFLGKGPNPCSGAEGATIMHWIDTVTR